MSYHDDFDPSDILPDLLPDFPNNPKWVRRALLVAGVLALGALVSYGYCLITQ